MNDKESKRFVDEMDQIWREVMTETDRARHDAMDTADDNFIAAYNRTEETEDVWRQYQMGLDKPIRDALRRDDAKYNALARLFFGARSHEKLAEYATMSVDELFSIVTEMDVKTLEEQEE